MVWLANHADMPQVKPISTLVAARQALAEQQIRALRDWLGEDHELLNRAALSARAVSLAPRTAPVLQPQIHDEVSA